MLYSVMYNDNILNRYICDLHFKGKARQCIIDTACSTALIPLKYAKLHGQKLNHTATTIVGGHTYKSTLYLFDDVILGNLNITKMVAFAADYKGNIEDRILLGMNVLNNLEILLSRHKNSLLFDYEPWQLVQTKTHPCAMFFKDTGANPVYPTELLAEERD